jgi:uncharacterized protein (DUF1800 family)
MSFASVRSAWTRWLLAVALTVLAPCLFAADWSREDAAHLLRRAGFGGTPEQASALHALGRDAAVDYLLTGQLPAGAQPVFPAVTFEEFKTTPVDRSANTDRKELVKTIQRTGRQDLVRYRGYWVDRMIRTDRPLEEKMTLFWHGLLCSGIQEVKLGDFMVEQNQLYRKNALGNYKQLIAAIIHDPAMLRYLDADKNVVGKPNENLAREIMELFTMGEGQGYTEKDIAELARALTGMGVLGRDGAAGFRPLLHDRGSKTIFGQTGYFKPDDVPELIFSRPQPPQYLAKKLWEFYAFPNPTAEDIQPVAQALRDSKFELKPALRALFTSPAFYSEQAKFALIQSPTELCVSTARTLGISPPGLMVASQLGKMGQELFQPPNVKGWPGGEQWITAATLFNRYNVCSAMVEGKPLGPPGGMFFKPNNNKPNAQARAERFEAVAAAKDGAAAAPGAGNADNVPPGARMARMRQMMMQRRFGPNGGPGGPFGPGMMQAVSPAKLFPDLAAAPTGEQVVDAAVARFLQRPLNAEKRKTLVESLGAEPIKVGQADSDRRVREMLSLLLSTPEYQVH